MSIPLKIACCAATVTMTLTSGIARADEPDKTGDPQHGDRQTREADHHRDQPAQWKQLYQDSRREWAGHARPQHEEAAVPDNQKNRPQGRPQSRTAQRAQKLAEKQRSVRNRRAALEARWQRKARTAVGFARSQRGKPYVWGGTGRGGYDCSGLVQRSWRRAGVQIPRVAASQYRRIRTKVSRRNLRPGDLVFFNNLGHVGMYVGKGRFIHSPRPGRHVTVERLRGYYNRRYVGARRPAWKPLPAVPSRMP